jgi:hypothetical protein
MLTFSTVFLSIIHTHKFYCSQLVMAMLLARVKQKLERYLILQCIILLINVFSKHHLHNQIFPFTHTDEWILGKCESKI